MHQAGSAWMARIDPRLRLGFAFAFALLIYFFDSFAALLAALGLALFLAALARVLSWTSLKRLSELNLFMLFLFAFMAPAVQGQTWFTLLGLNWSLEGLVLCSHIALKANSIMITFLALVGTLEPILLGQALSRMGLPEKLAHLFFFTVRYLEVVRSEYLRLNTSLRMRAFKPGFNLHSFRTYGQLVGMLLIRSLDRAERVVVAMKMRGFQNKFYSLHQMRFQALDLGVGLGLASSLVPLGLLEWGPWTL